MKIEDKCVVTIAFTLRNRKGSILDSSESFVYTHGSGTLVKGLEKALAGKQAGDGFEIRLEPNEAFGDIMPAMIRTMPRSAFQGMDGDLEVGMEFKATRPDGRSMVVRIDEIDGDDITVNGNHPFAGATLDYEVRVLDVKEAE
jgi:FKBP-type peptidyl-prolyl cis-trans isomerase SlyD